MRDPARFRLDGRLDGRNVLRFEMTDAVGDPVDMLLDGEDHVRLHRRAARPGDDKEVGKSRHHQPEVGAGAVGPLVLQCQALAAANVDLAQRAGHRVEAGREDDDVELDLLLRSLDALGGDALDRRGPQVDQRHVGAVVSLEVRAAHAEPPRADRVIGRAQCGGGLRVIDDAADLVAHEVGAAVVGLLAGQQIGEGGQKRLVAAVLPALLIAFGALLRAQLQRRLRRVGQIRQAEHRLLGPQPLFGINRFVALVDFGIERQVLRRHAEIGRALKHMQLLGTAGNHRDDLDTGRAGADHAHPLARQVDASRGPARRMVPITLEPVQASDRRQTQRREVAAGHHAVAHRDRLAVAGRHGPAFGGFIKHRAAHAGVEADVTAQIKAVSNVVDVAQDLGLRRVLLGPDPVLLEIVRKRVRILEALDVAAGAGVLVPEPGSAHAVAGFDAAHAQAGQAQLVHGIEAGKARAHHDRIEHVWAWFWVALRVCTGFVH